MAGHASPGNGRLAAAAEGQAGPDDLIAVAAGTPSDVNGTTNLPRIERLPGDRQAVRA